MKKLPFHSLTVGSAVKTVLIGSAAALPLMAASVPAFAQSNDQQIQQMQQQINALQSKVASMATQQSPKGAEASGFRVGNTTVKLGGYVKLDVIDHLNYNLGTSAYTGYINTHQSRSDLAKGGHVLFNARQSRVTIDTSTPTAMGAVKAHLEGDFYGAGGNQHYTNSYGFRLRQAYFTWNHWLFGQAWTTFEDFHYGTTLDFNGPAGVPIVRQPQIRYTFDLNKDSTLAVALENPQGRFADSTGAESSPPNDVTGAQDTLPDFVGRYEYNQGPVSFEVAGLVRRFKLNTTTFGNKSVMGWGADVGGSYSLPTGTTLMATFTGGKGIGRYIYEPAVFGAYLNSNGDAKALEQWAGSATIQQKLAPKWTTNLIYSFSKVQSLRGVYDAATLYNIREEVQDVHVNLLYRPVKPLMLGAEYIYSYARNQDGSQADANSIELSAQYDF